MASLSMFAKEGSFQNWFKKKELQVCSPTPALVYSQYIVSMAHCLILMIQGPTELFITCQVRGGILQVLACTYYDIIGLFRTDNFISQ